MKDAQGRVIYVGKAKNLRNRAGHYFSKAAAEDQRTRDLVPLIADIDFLPADSEVDALLLEARLVKDIQPRFNVDLKDDKTFPVPANSAARGVPARRVHADAAAQGGQALRSVHQRQDAAARHAGLAAAVQVPHLLARHSRGRAALALVPARACSTISTNAPPPAISE